MITIFFTQSDSSRSHRALRATWSMDGRAPSTDFVMVLAADGDVPQAKRQEMIHSNNNKTSDFVFVHTSPLSKRRALRASKELKEEERADLALKISLGTGQNFDGDDEISPAVAPESLTPNSLRSEPPATLERTNSYKNGRRVSTPRVQAEINDDEISPPTVPEAPALERKPSYKNGRRLSGETPVNHQKRASEPESPTSIATDAFCSKLGVEVNTLSKLLGDAMK